jgi:nitroreductase
VVQAPSATNGQVWQWLVITDADKRAAIGEYYRRAVRQYLDNPATAAQIAEGDAAHQRVQRKVVSSAEYLGDRMGQVPVLVIPCIQAKAMPAGSQAALWGSVLPAAWSYMLAARSRGLGTVWTTLHLRYEREISDLLGIPDDLRQAVLIPTAYSIGTDFKPAPRKPLDDVLHFDSW